MNPTTEVEVKSGWFSKINWTQGLAGAAMLLTLFGIDLDAKTQADILAAIIGVQAGITWLLRTFFTSSVTPSSIK